MGVTSEFFFLHTRDDAASAVADLVLPERISLPTEPLVPTDWIDPIFELRTANFCDYVPNTAGVRLLSLPLGRVLKQHIQAADAEWLPARVRFADDERSYYVLHFIRAWDVLDRSETLTAGEGFVVRPVLSLGKVRELDVFGFESAGTRLIVSRRVRDKIVDSRLSCVDFSRVRASSHPANVL